jgi:PAS domain S-box-containing protein
MCSQSGLPRDVERYRLKDVTARRQAEEELRAARRHLEYVLSMSPAVTYVLKLLPDGTVRADWTSENIERLTGFSAAESLAPGWWTAHVHPEDRNLAGERLATLLREGRMVQEYRLQHRDGSYLWIRDEGRLVTAEHDAGPTIVGAWTDITGRRQEQAEREGQREALAQSQKLADMGTLLASVAHELNNPLSILLGQAGLLVREAGESPVARRAQSMAQAADRCARIVRNFLSLARHHASERERLTLNRVVEDAVELLAYALRVDDVELVLDLALDLPMLWGDPHQLHQVVVNCLTNAHYAARQEPRLRRVRISTERVGDGARLTVEDSGPGIPETIRQQVFEPFFTTKPAGEGTGLGLPLCRGIVEGHGGQVAIDTSAVLGGARVVITLPSGVPPPLRTPATERPAAPSTVSHRILVVDDEPPLADVVAEGLREAGYAVDVVFGGIEALKKLRTDRFDLVLADIRMPQLDGICLYRACQALRAHSLPAFVFMTGDGLTPQTVAFLASPGRVHLEKPFTADQLRTVLGNVLDPAAPTLRPPAC